MRALALAVAVSTLAVNCQANAAGAAHRLRLRAEVRAIFAMLLSRVEPGDGWHYDNRCVFSEDWIDFVADWGRALRHVRPHAPLSLREALDPKGRHPEKFCDRKQRNAQSKELAKALPGDGKERITTADMDFSYPIFNRSLTRATLQHSGGNDSWFKDGNTDFVSSWRNVYLTKRKRVWTAQFETLGIAN